MRLAYVVRVLVPCYREELQIVARTVLAALAADLPAGCARTVYLCDDGKARAPAPTRQAELLVLDHAPRCWAGVGLGHRPNFSVSSLNYSCRMLAGSPCSSARGPGERRAQGSSAGGRAAGRHRS